MQGIFYIECFTRNDVDVKGYFESFEAAHDALITSDKIGNYDEVETTGRIFYQPFGLSRRAYLVCDRHGEFDVIEDYYDKRGRRVQSVRYQHKSIIGPQRRTRPAIMTRDY